MINPATSIRLKNQIKTLVDKSNSHGSQVSAIKRLLSNAFISYLATLLGFPQDTIDADHSLAMYGLDSLSGVGCQYWFWRGMFPRCWEFRDLMSSEKAIRQRSLADIAMNGSRCRGIGGRNPKRRDHRFFDGYNLFFDSV